MNTNMKINIEMLKKSDKIKISKCNMKRTLTDNIECFTKKELINILQLYNIPTKNLSNEELYNLVLDVSKCNNGKCISNKFNIKNVFLPNGTTNIDDPLWNYQIEETLKQYEEIFNDFYSFNGTICNNYILHNKYCVNTILNYMNSNNKTKFGIVINTDNCGEKGEHWVAIYFDLSKKILYFFDSYGDKPSKEIKYLMKKILFAMSGVASISWNKLIYNGTIVDYNKIQHQHDSNECGVYCLFFIYCMINNITMEEFNHYTINEKLIQKYRKFIFYNN